MQLNIIELKDLMSKLNLAIEKSKINPKSGWIELETVDDGVVFKVANYDYYLEATIKSSDSSTDAFHATLVADTFIPLISKLDADVVNVYEQLNSLILETDSSSYTFPIIKELGKVKSLDPIKFNATSDAISILGNDLSTVASINTKGLIDAVYSKDIQQYIYIDEIGAITFTENIYVNNFSFSASNPFNMLLTATQSKLLEIFKNENSVSIQFEQLPMYNVEATNSNKVKIFTNDVELILITQPQDVVDKFPSIKLRALAENTENTHVVLDKKLLDKALTRLMVFDKKFDITVLDYSKLVFKDNEVELVSIKNKNFEKIPYIRSQNAMTHESIVRFADLIKQLKAISSKEVDISYGSRPALVINSNIKQIIPEIKLRDSKI